MEHEILKTFGKIAGIGGLCLGIFLLVFREIIRNNFLSQLNRRESYKIIRLILILVWTIAVIGVAAWVYSEKKLIIRISESMI